MRIHLQTVKCLIETMSKFRVSITLETTEKSERADVSNDRNLGRNFLHGETYSRFLRTSSKISL